MVMRFLSTVFLIAAVLAVSGCVKATIAWADLSSEGVAASPLILDGSASGLTASDWRETRAPEIRAALEEHIYGAYPDAWKTNVLDVRIIDENAIEGAGILSEYKLKADLQFGDDQNSTQVFYMNVLTPKSDPLAPIVLTETFCPRWDTIPHPGVFRPEGADTCDRWGSGVIRYVFGRYISTPPLGEILKRGYGLATIFPSEYVPDRADAGLAALDELSAGRNAATPRWGSIAAWGLGFSMMTDALEAKGFDKFIAYGHSRYGKAALVAGAFDDRIDGVIAHQSGTGGASLNRAKKGESITEIVEAYPHWFTPAYAGAGAGDYDLGFDQHHLLALIAPRPILLGNARRDVWSDPNGAFRAAMGADSVYELFGRDGLKQERLDQWVPEADIAFWMRPGTHGVVKEDWPAFLEFLDAHFTAE